MLFFDHVLKYHGLPKDINFDHELQFAFNFWKRQFDFSCVKVKLSLDFHP
jgi:hypothetical protein